MSTWTHFDSLATHVTHFSRFSGDSGDELSTFLLIVSAIAMAGSGLGLIYLCARALLRRPPPPTQPWIAHALSSPTIHTRKYSETVAGSPGPPVETDAQPLSGPAPVTVPRPVLAPLAPVEEPPPPSAGFGPSSTDPTLEMDLRAFASYASSENDVEPVSERTEVSETREPILLVAKKRDPLQDFEIPPPPRVPPDMTPSEKEPEAITAHRSGTVPRANPATYLRTVSFNDSARRA